MRNVHGGDALTLGLLASHRGSNVQAVVEACRSGRLHARPGVIISNNANSGVLQFAQAAGIPARRVGGPAFADDDVRDRAILDTLREHRVDLVLLLGYMKLLGPRTTAAYRGRILNTHPALLPRHGGQGMYGERVHAAVLAAGDTETGVTVHLVDEQYDHGQVIAQSRVPVAPGDTVATLSARVLEREHAFLVETLQRIATGALQLDALRDGLLDEQIAYYRAVAPEYESLAVPGWGGDEAVAALDAFRPAGDVLELACGPGMWTERLLRHATSLTSVDAAPEMLARAKARVGESRVRFVQADLFSWRPDRRYDVVFFGFWLSHVPRDRFAAFWSLVADCLQPSGRVFFVDDAHRTPEELIEGESSSTIQRRLSDGRAFRAVKVPYEPAELEAQLAKLGWTCTVTRTSGPFYWAAGSRSQT